MTPFIAAGLSVVPGLGHWLIGRRGKAAALFVVDIGIIGSAFFLRSIAGYFLAFFVYLVAMIPAAMDAYALALGKVSRLSQSKIYIIAMLLIEGFTALPLLWHSTLFSKRVKIAWSVAVPVLALFYFTFLGVYGIRIYQFAKTRLG